MGYVERLTYKIDRHPVQLARDWQVRFQSKYPNDPLLGLKLMSSVEGWLTSSVVFIEIQRNTLAPIRNVRTAIKAISAALDEVGGKPNDHLRQTISPILTYRDEIAGPAARAHNVALDWIAHRLPSPDFQPRKGCALNLNSAQRLLTNSVGSAGAFSDLRNSVAGQLKFFEMSYEDRQAHVLKTTSKPDPRLAPKARPETAAYDVLAAALRDIYKCTGSPPNVPRDGRPSSPFLRFLEAARCALPRSYQIELVSPARRVQRDEKLNGPGTLERFKAKLYHPDCWSY